MSMTKIACAACALCLGLLLFAAQTAAADPEREAAVAMRGMGFQLPAAGAATTAMQEFLQCRSGCGPQCEGTGNAEQTERCKQRCEMGCNSEDGE